MPAPLPPPARPAAGWYPDRASPGVLRYWDGGGWTSYVAVQPAPAGNTAHPTLPLWTAVTSVAVLGISLIASRLLLDAVVRYRWPIVVYVVLTALVAYVPALVWSVVATSRASQAPWRQRLGLDARPIDLVWAPVTWLGAIAAEIAIIAVITAAHIPISSNTEGVDDLSADRTYVVSLLILAVVAAPIVEEIVFRAVVLRGLLSRYAAAVAITVQALLFGAAHIDPVRGAGNVGLALVTGAIGAAFGVAAYMLRRVTATILAHAILNGVVMAIVLSGAVEVGS